MHYTDFIKTFGYIIAPLFRGTCEWFLSAAKYPIKLSMRSSEPFLKTSKILIDIDDAKYAPMKQWVPIFINRDIASRLDEANIKLYCEKSGLQKPYTMCDIGYSNKIIRNMAGSDFAPNEFIQMFAREDVNYFDEIIRKKYPNNYDFLVNFQMDGNSLSIKFDEFFSHYIMHFLPKTHKKYNDASCAEFDSNGKPVFLANKNPFVDDFYKGVKISLLTDTITEQEIWDFFCNCDLPGIQHTLLMIHNNYDDSPWPLRNPTDLIIRGQDISEQTFDRLDSYNNQFKKLEKKFFSNTINKQEKGDEYERLNF